MDSQSLQLVFATSNAYDALINFLSEELTRQNYEFISPSVLTFLGSLECGVNYGSDIARNLGVSRQMVAKTVKDLTRKGYLQTEDDTGKKKRILFTNHGEALMADARKVLADLDIKLHQRVDHRDMEKVITLLRSVRETLNH